MFFVAVYQCYFKEQILKENYFCSFLYSYYSFQPLEKNIDRDELNRSCNSILSFIKYTLIVIAFELNPYK